MGRIGIVLAVVIVALLGTGRWLAQRDQTADKSQPAEVTTPDNSDYYVRDATLYQLSPEGSLAYRARTAQALHFPDGSARLDDVDVHYVKGTDGAWDMQADKARMPPGARAVYLYDGVTGQHPMDNGQVMHFQTSHVWVRPEDDLVTTDAPVEASRPGQRITGRGMRVDLNTDTLNLLNDVQVTYDP